MSKKLSAQPRVSWAVAAATSDVSTASVAGVDGDSDMPFIWPGGRVITSGMGDPRPYGSHEGIDIAPSADDLKAGRLGVRSIAPGVVERVGYMPKGYGKYIVIRHPDGMRSLYGHLSSIGVREGESVAAGAPIGAMGSTGLSTGVHLHLSLIDRAGRYINPLKVAWDRTVSLATRKPAPVYSKRDTGAVNLYRLRSLQALRGFSLTQRRRQDGSPLNLRELIDFMERYVPQKNWGVLLAADRAMAEAYWKAYQKFKSFYGEKLPDPQDADAFAIFWQFVGEFSPDGGLNIPNPLDAVSDQIKAIRSDIEAALPDIVLGIIGLLMIGAGMFGLTRG